MDTDPRLYFLMRRLMEVQGRYFSNMKIRIIDVGCADGSFMQIAQQHLSNVEKIDGIDVPSPWSKDTHLQTSGTIYIQDLQQGVGDVPLRTYHIATLWEVIEHIENIYAFLRNLRRLITNDGIIMLSTPNLLSLSRFIKRQRWVGIAEQDHKYLLDILSLSIILKRTGFSHVSVKSYFFPSIGISFDWLNKLLTWIPIGGMLYATAYKDRDDLDR